MSETCNSCSHDCLEDCCQREYDESGAVIRCERCERATAEYVALPLLNEAEQEREAALISA